MKRLTFILFSLSLCLYISAQDITGYWQYQNIEPIIKTNDEDVTKSIVEYLKDEFANFINDKKGIINFQEDGIYTTEGGSRGKYKTENNKLIDLNSDFNGAEFDIKDNTLTLSIDVKETGMLNYILEQLEINPNNIKIEEARILFHLKKLPDNYKFENKEDILAIDNPEDYTIESDMEDIEGEDAIMAVEIASIADEKVITEEESMGERPFHLVEQMPHFQGGEQKMIQFIKENLRYPQTAKENNIYGRVVIQFVVNKDGTISNISIIKGVDKSLNEEAIRLTKSMPRWVPGKQNGKVVPVYYSLPISFDPN